MNLRRRVATALVAIVAVLVTAQGTIAYLALEEQEDDVVDALVLGEANRLAKRIEQLGVEASDIAAHGPNLEAWFVDRTGRPLPGPLPAHLAALADGPHLIQGTDTEYHLVVLPAAGGRLYLQYDARDDEAKVRHFAWFVAGLSALCILFSIIVALRVAAVVVAPIERVTRLLNHWAPDALTGKAAAGNEEEILLEAFARVQARFEQAIARERELVADLRHEMRTPLTVARTDLEMLAHAETPESPQRARLQRALASIDALSGVIEAAQALSTRRRIAPEPVNLAQCVDDAWASLGTLPRDRGLRFSNLVAAGTIVQADPHALLTVLRNLIRNAAEHAAPATCTVRYAAGRVEVSDDGPGIPAQDLPHLFERYYRGRRADSPDSRSGDDRGLGLAIAHDLAQANRWTLRAATDEPGGAKFILAFDENLTRS